MIDSITTPLLFLVLGKVADELITDACKGYLQDKLKSLFQWLETLGERNKIEIAYQAAMDKAYKECIEMLLLNIMSFGYSEDELKQYQHSIKLFIKNKRVAEELFCSIREPSRSDLPSHKVFEDEWNAIGGLEIPSSTIWQGVARAFRRKATKKIILSSELRELFNAQN